MSERVEPPETMEQVFIVDGNVEMRVRDYKREQQPRMAIEDGAEVLVHGRITDPRTATIKGYRKPDRRPPRTPPARLAAAGLAEIHFLADPTLEFLGAMGRRGATLDAVNPERKWSDDNGKTYVQRIYAAGTYHAGPRDAMHGLCAAYPDIAEVV